MTLIDNFQQIMKDLSDGNNNLTVTEYVELLEAADHQYHNEQESFMTDSEYDALRATVQNLAPTHPYFIGVGSAVRGGKVTLPFQMGSLNQVQIGDIEKWVSKNNLEDETVIVSDKMDGTSALIVYDENGDPQIAYSRGNGYEGADISRHIFKISNVPPQIYTNESLIVRAEVEISEQSFKKLQTIMSRSGKPYKTARNMTAGLMNSKTNPDIVYEHLSVIAYEVLDFPGSKKEQLQKLEEVGFSVVPYSSYMKGRDLTDEKLADFLEMRKAHTDFAIDGIVIDVDSEKKRAEMNPTRDTLNPDYSIKYKVTDTSNYAETTVVEVEWNLSKHGYLKPRLILEPVTLVGVTVTHATGYNAKYIVDNNIGKGAIVAVSRMGDVVPNVVKVIKATNADLPDEEFTWTTNDKGENVDIIIIDHHNNSEVKVQQAIDFFMSIETPHLREGNIRKLAEHTSDDIISDIIQMSQNQLVGIVGENGNKIYNGLHSRLNDIPLHVLAGSVPVFGRGVGKRKFKKLIKGLGIKEAQEISSLTTSKIAAVDGFEEKTAQKIVDGSQDFLKFITDNHDYINIAKEDAPTGNSMAGQKVVFTGFRDAELQVAVELAGGEMQSSVSGKTTMLVTKDPNSTSGKVQKARDKGVRIVGIEELKSML